MAGFKVTIDSDALAIHVEAGLLVFQKSMLVTLATKMEEMFKEWQTPWHRKYPVSSTFRGRKSVVTGVDNNGGTGTSPYDDRGAREGVPQFVNYGTSVRFALLTKDFQRKTQVGSRQSGGGAGGLQAVIPSQPREGVAGTFTDEVIADEIEDVIFDDFCDLLWDAAFS